MFRKETSASYTSNRYTTLVMKADARQGLTRLIEEMAYVTPKEVPINRFCLHAVDKNVYKFAVNLVVLIKLTF